MGIQGLQEYVEVNCLNVCEEVDLKVVFYGKKVISVGQLVLFVDVKSCLKYFYGLIIDWVCGGQWNEMLCNVEYFIRFFC